MPPSAIRVGGAKVLNSDLCASPLVRPVQMKRLRVGGKTPADSLPIDPLEHALTMRREVDDLIIDKVDFRIDIAGREFREIADLRDRRSVCDDPQDLSVGVAPLLAPNTRSSRVCPQAGFALPALRALRCLARLSVEIRMFLASLAVVCASVCLTGILRKRLDIPLSQASTFLNNGAIVFQNRRLTTRATLEGFAITRVDNLTARKVRFSFSCISPFLDEGVRWDHKHPALGLATEVDVDPMGRSRQTKRLTCRRYFQERVQRSPLCFRHILCDPKEGWPNLANRSFHCIIYCKGLAEGRPFFCVRRRRVPCPSKAPRVLASARGKRRRRRRGPGCRRRRGCGVRASRPSLRRTGHRPR